MACIFNGRHVLLTGATTGKRVESAEKNEQPVTYFEDLLAERDNKMNLRPLTSRDLFWKTLNPPVTANAATASGASTRRSSQPSSSQRPAASAAREMPSHGHLLWAMKQRKMADCKHCGNPLIPL